MLDLGDLWTRGWQAAAQSGLVLADRLYLGIVSVQAAANGAVRGAIDWHTPRSTWTIKGNIIPATLSIALLATQAPHLFGQDDGGAGLMLSDAWESPLAAFRANPDILRVQNTPALATHCITCPVVTAAAASAVKYVQLSWESLSIVATALLSLAGTLLIAQIGYDRALSPSDPRWRARDIGGFWVRLALTSVIIGLPNLFDTLQTFLLNPLIAWPISMGRAMLIDLLPSTGLFATAIAQCKAASSGSVFDSLVSHIPALSCIAYANENGTWWPLYASIKMVFSWGNLLTLNFPAIIAGVVFFFASLRAAGQAPVHLIYLIVGGFITIAIFPVALALSVHPSYRTVLHRQMSAMAHIGLYAFLLTGCIILNMAIMDALVASLKISSNVQQLLNDLDSFFLYNSGQAAMNLFDVRFWVLLMALGAIGTIPAIAAQWAGKIADSIIPAKS